MKSTTRHIQMTRIQTNYIEPMPLHKLDQARLISIGHDQIRTGTEQIHAVPRAADALGAILGIVLVPAFTRGRRKIRSRLVPVGAAA